MLITTSTTTHLLEGLFDPDAEALWGEFDLRYRPIIVGLARRLGLSDEDAADLAQETLTRFIGAYRKGRYDRGKGRLRSWIIGIAKHVLADARTSRAGRRDWRGHSVLDVLHDDDQLTAIWENERRLAILARAVEQLRLTTKTSEQSIQAFEMVAFHHRSPEDVAAELGMTRHDVYVAKHRTTERLRDIVSTLESLYDAEE